MISRTSTRTFRASVAVAILASATLAAAPASASARAADGCLYIEVPGLGLACPKPSGFYELFSDRGTGRLTHGHDIASADAHADGSPDPGSAAASTSTPQDPACVTGGSHYTHIIYARPSDRPDQYATRAPHIRDLVRDVTSRLMDEANLAAPGAQRRYRVLCNASGVITISNEVLRASTAPDSFDTVVADLEAKGYASGTVKYWVWYDGSIGPGRLGTGHIYADDRVTSNNFNNGNADPMFAVLWGQEVMASYPGEESTTWMHELAHTMGAVQSSAPNSSGPMSGGGGGHCIDDQDVMCYRDGGSRENEYTATACTDREHFDCNHDDYFHPSLPPPLDDPDGIYDYLRSHWNIGSTVNGFLSATSGALLSFSSSTAVVSETAGSVTLDVTRTGALSDPVTVNYATANGSATAGSDFGATSGVLTFAANETQRQITVPITADGQADPGETFTVGLSSPSGGAALGSPNVTTIQITDDDGGEVHLGTASIGSSETQPIAIDVARTKTTRTAEVQWRLGMGPANEVASGTVRFAAGDALETLVFDLDDDVSTGRRDFLLSLHSPTRMMLGDPASATIILTDDDIPPTIGFVEAIVSTSENAGVALVTVSRSDARAPGAVTVEASSGSATLGMDAALSPTRVNFAVGESSRQVEVEIFDDTFTETAERISLRLVDPSPGSVLGSSFAMVEIAASDQRPDVSVRNEVGDEAGGGSYGGGSGDRVQVIAARIAGGGGTARIENDGNAAATFVVRAIRDGAPIEATAAVGTTNVTAALFGSGYAVTLQPGASVEIALEFMPPLTGGLASEGSCVVSATWSGDTVVTDAATIDLLAP